MFLAHGTDEEPEVQGLSNSLHVEWLRRGGELFKPRSVCLSKAHFSLGGCVASLIANQPLHSVANTVCEKCRVLRENIEESPHDVLRERASGTVSNGLKAKEIIFTACGGGDGWQALGQLEGTVCTDPGGERESSCLTCLRKYKWFSLAGLQCERSESRPEIRNEPGSEGPCGSH